MQKSQVHDEIVAIVLEMKEMYDIELGPLSAETRLVEDMGLSSVTIMHLLASVDMRFQKRLPFMDLMRCGDAYVSELTIGALVDFVHRHLDYEEQQMAM